MGFSVPSQRFPRSRMATRNNGTETFPKDSSDNHYGGASAPPYFFGANPKTKPINEKAAREGRFSTKIPKQSPRTYCFAGAVLSGDAFAFLGAFFALGAFVFFLADVVVLSVEPLDPLEPVCATARLAPSINVTTNISSFFMPSPSEV